MSKTYDVRINFIISVLADSDEDAIEKASDNELPNNYVSNTFEAQIIGSEEESWAEAYKAAL